MKKIEVYEIPNCTWELDGDSFFCTHDEIEIEEAYQDRMGFQGHYQDEFQVYVCADEDCGEQLDGSPAEDAHDAMVDAQIDEARENGY